MQEYLTNDFMKDLLSDFLRKTGLCMCAIKTIHEPYKGKEAILVKFRKTDCSIRKVAYAFQISLGQSSFIYSLDKPIVDLEAFSCSLIPLDKNGFTDLNETVYTLPISPLTNKEDMKVKIKSFLEQALDESNETQTQTQD